MVLLLGTTQGADSRGAWTNPGTSVNVRLIRAGCRALKSACKGRIEIAGSGAQSRACKIQVVENCNHVRHFGYTQSLHCLLRCNQKLRTSH